MNHDAQTTTIPCPKCHALILLPAAALKGKCRECGEVVKMENPEKVRTKQ